MNTGFLLWIVFFSQVNQMLEKDSRIVIMDEVLSGIKVFWKSIYIILQYSGTPKVS